MTKKSLVLPEISPNSSLPYPLPRPASVGATASFAIKKRFLTHLEVGTNIVSIPNALVESMQASSPTHIKAGNAAVTSHFAGDCYNAWLAKHPSALDMFEEIVVASKGKQIVMFLDYDGTLSPIVDDPDSAFMSDAMRGAVRDAARYFPTAIVSGRCRDKVYDFVRLAELYYAGSHGMDIKGPVKGPKHTKTKAKPVLFQPASEFLPMISEVFNALSERTRSTPGVIVENNKFCVSVHFRCVEEKRWSSLAEEVGSIVKEYPKLTLTQGRKVFEVRPTIKWDKGKALEFLLESLGFADCENVLPVYIGDDRTDEDAFKVLRERGQGIGILVSKFAKETSASYSLQEPTEVMDFLHRLVGWKRQKTLKNKVIRK
ncbi:probable trehalose-phosphate phosphatase 6 [Dioscorea cayenensis subsp. rotundata]|uniref:Trehalose 6-phosphate phosphatase n=1 Tax=Dioscorea cayennensis subsp. rotundata TaxID=55577 RepID=A0AB40CWP6_DIOCR|nr:probable trehalose-phosphate phosphatase 6 [Dioscorea cayenensis subsp. rotundata]